MVWRFALTADLCRVATQEASLIGAFTWTRHQSITFRGLLPQPDPPPLARRSLRFVFVGRHCRAGARSGRQPGNSSMATCGDGSGVVSS
jgi:hypothetical protein